MNPIDAANGARLYHGDCLEVVRTFADTSIDAVVTDPPYGLGRAPDALAMLHDWITEGLHEVSGRGFMGKRWDAFVPQPVVWRELLRVMKPGAHLLAFGGTRTYDLVTLGLRLAGFEVRDCIMWVYGSGFPKSRNLKGEHEGWGTALKPAYEPIVVARKPLIGSVDENVSVWGTGALHVDAARVPFVSMEDRDESVAKNQHERYANPNSNARAFSGGFGPRTNYAEAKGRWPANLAHDGSEEVLDLFPESARWGHFPARQSAPSTFVARPGVRLTGERLMDAGSAARFFYCAKTTRRERDEGVSGAPRSAAEQTGRKEGSPGLVMEGRIGNPYTGTTVTPRRNHHPTVKPTALMRWLVRLVVPARGVVLDPYMGSGSTGIAAVTEGVRFVGIELEAEYLTIAQDRIAYAEKARATDDSRTTDDR